MAEVVRVEINWCSSHARHVSLCGLVRVLASYDEYTALVNSGEVTSVHVQEELGYRDPLSYVTFLLLSLQHA